jgi:serine/threonine protein kinase
MMMRILEPAGIFVGLHVEGTPGYCAPESHTKKHYTSKTDVWQAGCCLYSMLSGLAAFAADTPELVVEGKYAPMTGLAWDSISENAKDLVRKILTKDPKVRLSTAEILEHPWLQEGGAPEQELDAGYSKRIRKLALVHKMRTLFTDKDIQESSKMRRQSLVAALPFLNNEETKAAEAPGPKRDGGLLPQCANDDRLFFQKLKLLKSGVLYAVSPFAVNEDTKHKSRRTRRANSFGADDVEEDDRISVNRRTSDSSMFMKNHSSWKDFDLANITYPNFVSILHKVDLGQLANRQVFDIFDIEKSGTISVRRLRMTSL